MAVPPRALPPKPYNTLLGSLEGDEAERAAEEAARTAPLRENGGNQNINTCAWSDNSSGKGLPT